MLLLFIFSLFQSGLCVDKLISLTKTDASYAMSGYQFQTYQNIIVENKENPKGMIWVLSVQSIDGAAAPKVWITDDARNQSAINVAAYFGPKLTLTLWDRNTNFVIAFYRSDETNRSNNPPFNSGISPVTSTTADRFEVSAMPRPSMKTYISSDNTATPTMECQVREIKTPNCVVDMYLGGMPSEDGKPKYRLMSFTSDSINRYKTSYVYNYAVTFWIPTQCDTTITCRGRQEINDQNVDENSMGFFVSQEYPGVFDAYKNWNIGWGKTDGWTYPSNVNFDVVYVDAGKNGTLTITAGTTQKIYKNLTTEESLNGIGNSFQINWFPSDDVKGGFLARWSTTWANGTSQPTTSATWTNSTLQPTTSTTWTNGTLQPTMSTTWTNGTLQSTTPKSTSTFNLFNSVLFLLLAMLMRQI